MYTYYNNNGPVARAADGVATGTGGGGGSDGNGSGDVGCDLNQHDVIETL